MPVIVSLMDTVSVYTCIVLLSQILIDMMYIADTGNTNLDKICPICDVYPEISHLLTNHRGSHDSTSMTPFLKYREVGFFYIWEITALIKVTIRK